MEETAKMSETRATASIAKTFFTLAIALMLGFAAYIGRGVLIPLLVAGFLCFLIVTLKENINRAPFIGKYLPGWLCYIAAFMLIGAGVMIFVEIIKSNIELLLVAWPSYEERLASLGGELIDLAHDVHFLPEEFVGSVDQLQQAAVNVVRPLLSQVAGSLTAFTSNIFTFVTVFLYLVFLLIERARIFRKINLLTGSEKQRKAVNETIEDIGFLVRQYISVKTISNLVTATLSFAIMSVIGIQFAGFWALLIFVLNYIPIFGAASAITLPVLLALVQPDGGGVQLAVITLVSLVGAEQVMSNGIEPRIIGRTLNLSPLVVLLSLGVWGSLWGFAGLLLSVPITVSVMIILTQFKSTRPIAIMLSDNGEITSIKHPKPEDT